MIDLKKTLNLPSTKFPMKANLPVKELEIQKEWKETDIYNEMQTYRKDSPLFILHDGPPYANGNIHIGHAVNKILKDIILKSKFLSGFKTPYIPGWDCHGLPIELEVEKNISKKDEISDEEFRKKFTGSPIKRIGRNRFVRNCCIAAGNSKNKRLIPTLVNLLIKDKSFLVRGAAIWALQQLDNKKNLTSIKKRHLSFEQNNDVLAEWYI